MPDFAGLQAQPFTEGIHVGELADADHDGVAGNHKLRAWDWLRSWPATGIGPTEFHLQALKANHAPVRARFERFGRHQKHQLATLALCAFDLTLVGRHFCPRPPVDNRHLVRSATKSCARGVERGIASSDHQHAMPRRRWNPKIHAPQELHATADTR